LATLLLEFFLVIGLVQQRWPFHFPQAVLQRLRIMPIGSSQTNSVTNFHLESNYVIFVVVNSLFAFLVRKHRYLCRVFLAALRQDEHWYFTSFEFKSFLAYLALKFHRSIYSRSSWIWDWSGNGNGGM